jgi:TP901 family phage tail tape measure protein
LSSQATLELYIVAKDNASKSLKTIGGNVEDLGKQTDKLAKLDFGKFESGLASTADTLGKLALPMVGVGVAAGKMAMDFDTSLRNINSIAGLSESSLSNLGQSFIDLSLDSSKTLEGAGALADGFYDIQSSGFAGADGMKVLEAATKASSAGMTQTAVASRALTGALNAYGLGADQAGRVSDVMFQTVNAGVITFEQLAGSIGQVLPTAAAANVSIEQVGAAIASMTKSGIAGSVAVTDLNSLINAVIKPTQAASDAAKTFGFDLSLAALQSKGLNGFLADMVAKTGGGAENISTLITSQEGLAAALSLSKGNLQGFNADLDGMKTSAGAADRAFQEMSKAASSQIKIAKKDLEAAAISIGSVLLPKVVDATNAIAKMAESFAKLPKDERDKYTNIALGIGEATVAVYGFTKAVQAGIAVWGAGATVVKGVGTAIALVGGTAVASTALLAGLGIGIYELQQASDKHRDSLLTEVDALTERSNVYKDAQSAITALSTASGVDDRVQAVHTQRLQDLTDQYHALMHEQVAVREGLIQIAPGDEAAWAAQMRTQVKELNEELQKEVKASRLVAGASQALATVVQGTGSAYTVAAQGVQAATTAAAALAAVPLDPEALKAYQQALQDTATGAHTAFADMFNDQRKYASESANAATKHWQTIKAIDDELGLKTISAERRGQLETDRTKENETYEGMTADLKRNLTEQIAANRSALGTMLRDRLAAERTAPGVDTAKADAAIADIERRYGLLPDFAGKAAADSLAIVEGGIREGSDRTTAQIGRDADAVQRHYADMDKAANTLKTTLGTQAENKLFGPDEQANAAILTREWGRAAALLAEFPGLADRATGTIEELSKSLAAERTLKIHTEAVVGDVPERLKGIQDQADAIDTRAPAYVRVTTDSELTKIALEGTIATLDVLDRHPVVDKQVTTNAPAITGQINDTSSAYSGLAALPTPDKAITTNAPTITGQINDTGSAYNGLAALPAPDLHITTNAAEIANLLSGVTAAMGSIPTSKTIRIAAGIDPELMHKSPSPIEREMALIDEFASRTHVFTFATAGTPIGDLAAYAGAANPLGAGMSIGGPNLPQLADDLTTVATAADTAAAAFKSLDDRAAGMFKGSKSLGDVLSFSGSGGDMPGSSGGGGLGANADYGKQAGTGAGMGFGEGWQQGIEQITPGIEDTARMTFDQLQTTVILPWQDDTREFFGAAGFGFIGAASVGIMSAGGGLAEAAGQAGGAAGAALAAGLNGSVPAAVSAIGTVQAALDALQDKTVTVTVNTVHTTDGRTDDSLGGLLDGLRGIGAHP